MELGGILVGIVVFSMVTMAFSMMWIDAAANYGMASPANMTAFSRTVTSVNSTMKDIEREFSAEQANPANMNPLTAPFVVMRMFFGVTGMVTGLIADVSTLGETTAGGSLTPWWFFPGLMTIASIIIIMAILAAFLGRKP